MLINKRKRGVNILMMYTEEQLKIKSKCYIIEHDDKSAWIEIPTISAYQMSTIVRKCLFISTLKNFNIKSSIKPINERLVYSNK